MPGSIWFPFREGDRSEYLALYILSALGISIYVSRPEDIGVDFYCSLAKCDGHRMTFHSPFITQIKSISVGKICFGGPDDKNRWKKEEVEWLFNQELPLLIGFADKENAKLNLYNTSIMWEARYTGRNPGQIVFLPGPPGDVKDNLHPQYTDVPNWPPNIGDGRRCDLPLGAPVISISIDDVENKDKLEEYRKILTSVLEIEQSNITYRRLQIHFYSLLQKYTTNKPLEGTMMYIIGNPVFGANTDEQLKSISPIIGTLALNFKSQGKLEELGKLKSCVQLLPDGDFLNMLRKGIPELF